MAAKAMDKIRMRATYASSAFAAYRSSDEILAATGFTAR
jgi:hypothetical protein